MKKVFHFAFIACCLLYAGCTQEASLPVPGKVASIDSVSEEMFYIGDKLDLNRVEHTKYEFEWYDNGLIKSYSINNEDGFSEVFTFQYTPEGRYSKITRTASVSSESSIYTYDFTYVSDSKITVKQLMNGKMYCDWTIELDAQGKPVTSFQYSVLSKCTNKRTYTWADGNIVRTDYASFDPSDQSTVFETYEYTFGDRPNPEKGTCPPFLDIRELGGNANNVISVSKDGEVLETYEYTYDDKGFVAGWNCNAKRFLGQYVCYLKETYTFTYVQPR